MLPYIVLALTLWVAGWSFRYFATKWGVMDTPNQRSSHSTTVVRGGGIIFLIATLIWFIYSNGRWPWMTGGVLLVGLISLWDDFRPQSARLRLVVQSMGMILLFTEVGLSDWPVFLWALAFLVCLGAVNAFNFMDGINGITGIYALVNLLTFWTVNEYVFPFTNADWVMAMIIGVVVFLFFNFRKSALFFAGDVGSIALANIQIFLLLQLIHKTDNLWWVVFFWVFGMDAVITILYRIRRKENILTPHRTHLYQYFANELGYPHRQVALVYGLMQCLISGVMIYLVLTGHELLILTLLVPMIVAYLWVRNKVMMKLSRNS